MRTALVLIATGEKYRNYAKAFITNAREYFVPHDVVLFTDKPMENTEAKYAVPYTYQGYPQASYLRYHAFTSIQKILSRYDFIFYSDVDMRFVAPVGEEIFSEGITATEHPGYVGLAGTPETNVASTAYCPQVRTYFCGGFNGGSTSAFLDMSLDIARDIDIDQSRGVQAIWVDESHLNRYLFDHPPSKILSPSYCYPEKDDHYRQIWARANRGPFEPRLLALEKGGH